VQELLDRISAITITPLDKAVMLFFNPIQTGGVNNGYMRRGMRDWLAWLKKTNGLLMVSALMQQNIMNTMQQKIGYTTFNKTPHLQMVLIA